MSAPAHYPSHSGAFVTTRWTQVLRARGGSPEAEMALGELCEAYWQPVYRFILREGRSEDSARELTQEFFSRLLARHGLDSVQPGRGRFRSFLLGAVKHFLADVRDRERAAKRGGGCESVSLNNEADSHFVPSPADPTSPVPDAYFDREWAVTLVNRVIETLAAEQSTADNPLLFGVLKPWLLGDLDGASQADAARQLNMTENAVRVAVHRLRKRFRQLIKDEISQTVETSGDVGQELLYLLQALSQQ